MRYTGIIDAPELERASFVAFETIDQGAQELAEFVVEHPGTTPVMDVGEPGDEGPRWVVTVAADGTQTWTVTNPSTRPAHNVEFTLA